MLFHKSRDFFFQSACCPQWGPSKYAPVMLQTSQNLQENLLFWFARMVCLCLPICFFFSVHSCQKITMHLIYYFLFLGRYDLHLPRLACTSCMAQWTPDRGDLIKSGYWPVSVNAETIFSVDLMVTFEEMKTVAPSLSRQGFLRMLERRTCHFGRVRSVWICSL